MAHLLYRAYIAPGHDKRGYLLDRLATMRAALAPDSTDVFVNQVALAYYNFPPTTISSKKSNANIASTLPHSDAAGEPRKT
jgi:hypothetical protein